MIAAKSMNFGDWAGAILDLVQIAAIVIGAIWAYYKFVKGRVWHRRAEPTVEATLISNAETPALRTRVTLENTGAADVPLRTSLLTIFSAVAGESDEHGEARWQQVARARVSRSRVSRVTGDNHGRSGDPTPADAGAPPRVSSEVPGL
jgi:hypothetical protein